MRPVFLVFQFAVGLLEEHHAVGDADGRGDDIVYEPFLEFEHTQIVG